MEQQGLVACLLVMLAVRVLGHTAFAYQSANKQVTAADATKTFALEWRMEATAHIASLMVRDQQCKGDPNNCDLQEGASDAIETLSKWAVGDQGWERLLSSVSLYAIARHAYQEAEYDEAIIALEESLALRLFAYADQKTLDRWQQGLVMPGSLFRRQKRDLANTLVLRSDCLVQLAREQRDVDDLTEAMELLQLATALLKGGDELVPDSVQAISRRAAAIASVAAELLPQLKTSRIKEVLEHHGISCSGCSSKGEFLVRLVPLLRLPVRVAANAGSSNSKLGSHGLPVIEVLPDPFSSHATALLKNQHEHVAQYMQRVFFRLLTLVPADYLAELAVACRRTDAKGRCISYLPMWVTAQAITIDKRTGLAHVSGPGACAGDGSGTGEDPSSDAPLQHSKQGSCISGSNAQLNSEPFFVPGDASGSGSMDVPDVEPHTRAGIELCGFLHIRAIPPGVALPTTGGSLTPQQQKLLKDKAVEGVASGQAMNTPFKGVYYYFYADIPALVDRIINTLDPEEADFLIEQMDNLTAAKSLHLANRVSSLQPKGCDEQILLEGKALPTCSVLVPNLGSCARAPLKPPRRRIAMDPIPEKLSLPPPVGTYVPKLRARVPPEAAWSWRAVDGSNGSGDRDGLVGGDGSSDGSAGQGASRAGRHHHRGHHHHGHFPLTDRELSDRQLQEQMAKLARDAGRRDRDDPLVPLTLAGCAVASFGLYLASKRRRRTGSSSTSNASCSGSTAARLVLLGLGAGRLRQAGSSSGALGSSGSESAGNGGSGVSLLSGAPLGGTGGSGAGPGADGTAEVEDSDGGAPGNRQKRVVAAALRVAMNNTDTCKLEAALVEAEAADLGEAGLLQRARVLLDKRKKKDQQKAAAEKAKLKALKKEEARKGRKAAAKRDAAEAAADSPAAACGPVQKQPHNLRAAGTDVIDGSSKLSSSPGAMLGKLQRLLQLFGLGSSSAATAAASTAAPCSVSRASSRASSGSLSRASSSGAGLSAAAAAGEGSPAVTAGPGAAKDAFKRQQTQPSNGPASFGKPGVSGTTSRSSSVSDLSTAGSKGNGNGGRAVSSHPISTEPSGSSVDDMYSTSDTAASPQSSATASSANSVPSAACAAQKSSSNSKRKGKGSSASNSQQQYPAAGKAPGRSSKTSAFDNPDNSMKSPLEIAAEIAAAAEARAAMLAKQALEKAAKQQKVVKQAPAAQATAAGCAGSTAGVSTKQLQQQKQRSQAGPNGSLATGGVTAPVTPPAVATPVVNAAARAAVTTAGSGQYGTPPTLHSVPQHHQHQGSSAAGALPSAWAARQVAVSDDGSSSTCSNTSKLTAASTPNKPRLNPKAAPYQPSPALSNTAKAAMAAAAAQQQQCGMFGYGAGTASSPGGDWRSLSGSGASGMPHGAFSGSGAAAGMLPMRGPSPIGGVGAWVGDAPGRTGLMLGGGSGSYHIHQQLGPADAGMDIGSGCLHHQGGGLLSYCSADQGVGPGSAAFEQGLTSPKYYQGNMELNPAAAALSPQQQYHLHQQQQLLELLSAAGPGDARYGIGSAGGSAPVNLTNHSGSMDAYIAVHAAAAARNQRNSYSSMPDHPFAAMPAGGPPAGGSFTATSRGGRCIPPGFDNVITDMRQQQISSRSGGLALNIDDDQLPPGFSAEDYTISTPSSSTNVSVPSSQAPFAPSTTMAMAAVPSAGTPTTLPSPSSIPTTAPLFAGGSSVWAPLAATAGTAASSVAASMRALWPSPLTGTSAAEHVHHHGAFGAHSYSRSQDLEVEVAAAATSANVAELVLGSSPSMQMAGAADAQMSKLAKEIAMGLLD